MRKLSYFRQQRVDGATRTGITIDGYIVLHSFENEAAEPDPALLWYVDVRCEAKHLPKEAEEARAWFLTKSAVIRQALNQLADELQAGLDVSVWPLLWNIPGTPRGLRMKIGCSVMRRLEALDTANILRGVANVFESTLHAIALMEATH